jgi:menaquinone-dependent protoporphyrinogen IX oxidase
MLMDAIAELPGPKPFAARVGLGAAEGQQPYRPGLSSPSVLMKVAVYYHTKYGNNKKIAERINELLKAKGVDVSVQSIDHANPKELPKADLYVFGCGTRMGKPVGAMKRFIKKASKRLPDGTKYALVATHGKETPNKKTGKMPPEEEIQRNRRTLPILAETMGAGKTKVAELVILIVYTTGLAGVAEEGWEQKVDAFVAKLV